MVAVTPVSSSAAQSAVQPGERPRGSPLTRERATVQRTASDSRLPAPATRRATRPTGPWGTVAGPIAAVDIDVRARNPEWTAAAQTMTKVVATATGWMPGRAPRRRCRLTRRRTARRPWSKGTRGLYQVGFMHAPLPGRVDIGGWCASPPVAPRGWCQLATVAADPGRRCLGAHARRPGEAPGAFPRCGWGGPRRARAVRRWRLACGGRTRRGRTAARGAPAAESPRPPWAAGRAGRTRSWGCS